MELVNGDNKISSRQENEEYEDLRNFIKTQDGHACVICNKTSSKSELHVHHIIPLSSYGTNQHINLVTLCLSCHKKQHAAFDITANKAHKTRTGKKQDNIFVAINIKTTGNLDADDIFEVSAARFENGVNKQRFHSYVYSEQYKPELFAATGTPKQAILFAEKPSKVFDKLLIFIGEDNLVFHDANYVLSFFGKYPNLYQSLSRRNITDTFKIAEKRKFRLKDRQLTTLLEYLHSHTSFSSYIDREESINIGLAFIALSKTTTIQSDKQKTTVSTGERKNPAKDNNTQLAIQPEETMDYAYQLYKQQNYLQAFGIYRKFAKEGNAIARFNLGIMYANAQGVKNNDHHAVYCYQKAADQGYAVAQFNLGVMYASGRGVAQDDEISIFWYSKAAEQGYASAQYFLGQFYEDANDDFQAAYWYGKAAEQGDPKSQNKLGWMFEKETDYDNAAYWYSKAAEQGNKAAKFSLDWLYYRDNNYVDTEIATLDLAPSL